MTQYSWKKSDPKKSFLLFFWLRSNIQEERERKKKPNIRIYIEAIDLKIFVDETKSKRQIHTLHRHTYVVRRKKK